MLGAVGLYVWLGRRLQQTEPETDSEDVLIQPLINLGTSPASGTHQASDSLKPEQLR